jgi:hypothetical protein
VRARPQGWDSAPERSEELIQKLGARKRHAQFYVLNGDGNHHTLTVDELGASLALTASNVAVTSNLQFDVIIEDYGEQVASRPGVRRVLSSSCWSWQISTGMDVQEVQASAREGAALSLAKGKRRQAFEPNARDATTSCGPQQSAPIEGPSFFLDDSISLFCHNRRW